jgi:hypothetical protein
LKKAQYVSVSLDDRRVYCIFDQKASHILDRETGETIITWPGVKRVWESPYESLMLVDEYKLVINGMDDTEIAAIPRKTFAVLCVAFAPGLVCISESGGALRCLETKTGLELWSFSQTGRHFLTLGYAESADSFVGTSWSYELGGSHQLWSFQSVSGKKIRVSDLGKAGEFAFFQRSSRLLASDGTVLDAVTGKTEYTVDFST